MGPLIEKLILSLEILFAVLILVTVVFTWQVSWRGFRRWLGRWKHSRMFRIPAPTSEIRHGQHSKTEHLPPIQRYLPRIATTRRFNHRRYRK